MTVRFDINSVQQLRKQAAEAMRIPNWQQAPPGWSLSAADFNPVVDVFPSLRIKRGCRLVGYLCKEGQNGHGAVWAVEGDSEWSVDVCKMAPYEARVRKFPIRAPRPPNAFDHFMMGVEGDGSPASYLGASLFARTIAEFGGRWHGLRWSHEQILGGEPPYCDPPSTPSLSGMPRRPRRDRGISHWIIPKPEILEPTFQTIDDRPVIVMHTYSEFGNCHVSRITDRYDIDEYTFQTERETAAEGPAGYVV